MNRNIIYILIGIIIAGSGFYLISQKNAGNKSGHNMETMNGKPAAQSHRSYDMELLTKPDTQKSSLGNPTTIKYKIKNAKGEVIKNFETVHETIMHFVVIRKDLQQFEHLHPIFDKNSGEFSTDVTFVTDSPYRLFAEYTPTDDNPQKISFVSYKDIDIGDISKFQPHSVGETKTVDKVPDAYEITYSIPNTIKKGREATIKLNVKKDGQEVTDIEKYLGAQAHGILLKKDILDFTHLHAMGGEMTHEMNGQKMTKEGSMPNGPEIKFYYTFPESGVYKLFTQFQHRRKVVTTDNTITVK